MRRILVEAARKRRSRKRGGDMTRQDLDDVELRRRQPTRRSAGA